MYNTRLQPTNTVKYLGVYLDKTLNFNTHIDNCLNKAQKSFMALLPLLSITSPLENELKIFIYKQYIRPIVLYACPIYSSASKNNINKIQIFQNKILRIALRKRKRTRIKELHALANLQEVPDKISEFAHKFYLCTTKTNPLTKHISDLQNNNAPFRVKHKLSHNIILT